MEYFSIPFLSKLKDLYVTYLPYYIFDLLKKQKQFLIHLGFPKAPSMIFFAQSMCSKHILNEWMNVREESSSTLPKSGRAFPKCNPCTVYIIHSSETLFKHTVVDSSSNVLSLSYINKLTKSFWACKVWETLTGRNVNSSPFSVSSEYQGREAWFQFRNFLRPKLSLCFWVCFV